MDKIFYKPPQTINTAQEMSSEMTSAELCFLHYLLKTYKPAKVLEIGVSCGGTSAFILKNCSGEVYGIDINENYYRNREKKTGFIVNNICEDLEKARYHLITGRDPVESLDETGGEIDLCVLDTIHKLPGELLHFIALYKYMKPGGILVLHDLNLNRAAPEGKAPLAYHNALATKVLFSILGSRVKILPDATLPNIGAVQMDDFTDANLSSVFFALSISWAYFPEAHLIEKYREFIQKNYPPFALECFNNCLEKQQKITRQLQELERLSTAFYSVPSGSIEEVQEITCLICALARAREREREVWCK